MAVPTRSTAPVLRFSLLRPLDSARMPAELYHAIEEADLCDIETLWRDEFDRRKRAAAIAGLLDWRDEDDHWHWRQKHRKFAQSLAFEGFSVVAEGVTQGLMYVATDGWSRLESGKQALYVDYLATAPWNRPHPVAPDEARRLRGAGEILIHAAARLSLEEDLGLEGRVSLHALPNAREFYQNAVGMRDFGPDAHYQGLHYFEMTRLLSEAYLARSAKPSTT